MLPRVIVHNAVSADGRIDWFAPDIGLFYKLASTWNEDATLAGSDTILATVDPGLEDDDEPGGGGIDPNDTRPLLVIPDSRGRIRCWNYLRGQPFWRGAVALISKRTPSEYLRYLHERNVDFIIAGEDRVDLTEALEQLALGHNVKTVRVDSGGTLNGVLLRAGLVHEVSVLVHPALVGGVSPRSIFRADDLAAEDGVIRLKLIGSEAVEHDIVWLRYEVVNRR